MQCRQREVATLAVAAGQDQHEVFRGGAAFGLGPEFGCGRVTDRCNRLIAEVPPFADRLATVDPEIEHLCAGQEISVLESSLHGQIKQREISDTVQQLKARSHRPDMP